VADGAAAPASIAGVSGVERLASIRAAIARTRTSAPAPATASRCADQVSSRAVACGNHHGGGREFGGLESCRARAQARIALQTLEIGAQISGALIAQFAILFERFGDDAIEFRGNRRVERARRRRLAIEDPVEDDRGRGTGKARSSGCHLVQDHPEGEKIGAWIKILTARLLGRHIRNRADRRADLTGELLRGLQVVRTTLGQPRRQLGETEVEDLDVAAVGQKDVGRLDIAVQDAIDVRVLQRIRDLSAEVEQQGERQRVSRQLGVERLALEQLHGQEELSILLVKTVDGADIGVVQARGGACLATKALRRLAVLGVGVRQHLQRDQPSQPSVLGLVDNAHPAGAQLIEDLVLAECLADLQRHLTRDLEGEAQS
jgi:hypothetical protein